MSEFKNDIDFREFVQAVALKGLRGAMNEGEAKRIAGQTALGFFTAMRTARDPMAYLNCSRASVASAVATSVGTRLVAGGPNAPAYLVPQSARRGEAPELQFRVNHRGWAVLGLRAGFLIDPIPVSVEDDLEVNGPDIKLVQDPDRVPRGWEDMRGVVVYITHLDSGTRLTAWVPKTIIERRKAEARTDMVWKKWPVEMSMGAAVRYCVARGKLPIDTVEVQFALAAEPQVIEGEVSEAPPRQIDNAHDALGLSQRPALDVDATPAQDLAAEAARLNDRELVEVDLSALPNVLEEFKARIGDPYDLVEDCGGVRTKDLAQQDESVQRLVLARMNDELSSLDD